MAKILIIDDLLEERELMRIAVKAEGRDVIEAASTQQALQFIQDNDFDVVVTDLKMEKADSGFDVLRAAKNKDIYTQVIMVTAYGNPDIGSEAMRQGAFDYLERISGHDNLDMLRYKVNLAIEFHDAKAKGKSVNERT